MSHPSGEGCDLDGFLSWEDFFGPHITEDLLPTLVGMYDAMVESNGPLSDKASLPTHSQWSSKVGERWNCRCTGKAASLAVTRCAACISLVRSTDIRDSPPPQRRSSVGCNLLACPVPRRPDDNHLYMPDLNRNKFVGTRKLSPSSPTSTHKCHLSSTSQLLEQENCFLVKCSAGNLAPNRPATSTPSTPTSQRSSVSPLALKRLRADGHVSRPLSVSSITSSSSSTSGGSLGVPLKSSYLASIESLEDVSEAVRRKSQWFKCDDSQGSVDSGVHSSCCSSTSPGRQHYSYMDRVVMEIVQTEQVYVRDLQAIVEGYLHHWRAQSDFPIADRLTELFGNIEDIYRFNSSFLKDLEQCGLDPVKVARCFVRNNMGFSIYTHYCTNYPRTVSSLTELMRQEATVRLFRERQTALQQTLPLGSYLLKPVQRILKYHLLLQNIVKQSVKDVVGYADIEDALSAMTGIAQHINDMKRRHEHAVRVQEIQSLLHGWEGEDLTTFGELCAEGAFRMSGAKALRHIFLFDKILLITKKKEEGVLGYKVHINCSNLMLVESVPGEPLSFHVIPFDNPRFQYTLQARNLEQKRQWTLQIKRAILENYNAVIPNHARQLVMELGQNHSDGMPSKMADRCVPKKQHSAPEYLERRKQDRRKSDAGFRARLRRSRKSDAGSSIESQQKFSESAKKNSSELRRQSEPLPRCDSSSTVTAASDSSAMEPCLSPVESPDKVSIDLDNPEEVQTIEHIVGQLLMQNREFEKVLKRQRHQVNMRSRNRETNCDDRSEATDDEEDRIYETLLNVKLILASNPDDEGGSDYVTLLYKDDDPSCRKSNPCNSAIRRTGSFQHCESLPLKLLGTSISDDSMNIPTHPSVWLQQQGQHLATPTKKADSLPRSFQMNVEGSDETLKDARSSVERPFTIASDQPNPMLYGDRYCRPFPLPGEIEDESLIEIDSTPGNSTDRIDVHPDYRIYRSGVSARVLKQTISSVGTKLAHLKVDISSKVTDQGKILQWERKASRLVHLLARQCSKTIRSRLTSSSASLDVSQVPPAQPPSLRVFMQGSSDLGARIANCSASLERVRPKAAAILGIEPNSLIQSSTLNSFDTECTIQLEPRDIPVASSISFVDANDASKSDLSFDGYYERSFEAMDDELSKNGNTFVDSEEHFTDEDILLYEPNVFPTPKQCPPPVPAKPRPKSPSEKPEVKVQSVEDEEVFRRSKSIRERQRDLEQWRLRKEEEEDTSSQNSTASTVIEVDHPRPTGWVRHVVGKLQADLSKTDS